MKNGKGAYDHAACRATFQSAETQDGGEERGVQAVCTASASPERPLHYAQTCLIAHNKFLGRSRIPRLHRYATSFRSVCMHGYRRTQKAGRSFQCMKQAPANN